MLKVNSVHFRASLHIGCWRKTARLWPVVSDRSCRGRVHELPFSDCDKERFGITDEWSTPEVSAARRAELGLDKPDAAPSPVARAAVSPTRHDDVRFWDIASIEATAPRGPTRSRCLLPANIH